MIGEQTVVYRIHDRIDRVQASGLAIAEPSALPGVSAAFVYRWRKL